MKLDWAHLSNSAEVRDGLVYVLGGGWDTGWRPSFPAPFLGALTLSVRVHPSEISKAHQVELLFWDADGKPFAPPATLSLEPGTIPDKHPTGWDIPANIAIGLQNLPIPSPGFYSIEILIDGQHQRSVRFRFVQGMPPAPQPPSTSAPPG